MKNREISCIFVKVAWKYGFAFLNNQNCKMHLKGITSTEKRGIVTIPHSAKRERIVTWIDNRGSTEDVKEQIRGFI